MQAPGNLYIHIEFPGRSIPKVVSPVRKVDLDFYFRVTFTFTFKNLETGRCTLSRFSLKKVERRWWWISLCLRFRSAIELARHVETRCY